MTPEVQTPVVTNTDEVTPVSSNGGEKPIDLNQAGVDQAPEQQPTIDEQKEKQEDVVELLTPKAEVKNWEIGTGEAKRSYTQRPLSFMGKIEWFALVGEVIDKAMGGENALTVGNLLSAPGGRGGMLSMEDFRDADTFVQAVGKLLVYAPDFLEKSFCIWLGVPDYERDIATYLMKQNEDEGGLSDDDGLEIIERFIDQNYEALDRFFREKVVLLGRRVQDRRKEVAAKSPQSKR